jgi:uncharacterized protein (DUF433 family)
LFSVIIEAVSKEAGQMAGVDTRYEHVVLDDHGTPYLASTTMKVVERVTAQVAYGWSPEELHFQYPYLTLGQIYSALAYYWDHREELDQDINRRLATVEAAQRTAPPSPLPARLRAQSGR